MSEYFEDSREIMLKSYCETMGIEERDKAFILYFCLGDVLVSKAFLEAFFSSFYILGGRYDVRTSQKTIKGMYEIYKKFPRLSTKALEEIYDRYIDDLFLEYDLISVFEKIIMEYGETDKAAKCFFKYVDSKHEELDKSYEEKAKKLYRLSSLYDVKGKEDYKQYIAFLYRLIMWEHIPLDAVIDSMPSPETVKRDICHYDYLAEQYGSYVHCFEPLSFEITKSLAKGEDISKYKDRPAYYLSCHKKYEYASFTIKDFLDSIDPEKTRKLLKDPQAKTKEKILEK